jgi:hypothetical protein
MNGVTDPIHIAPRMLPRRWGRVEAPAWCAGAARPPGRIGEIWLTDAKNVTRDGVHLGELLAAAPNDVLGDLGRAPPSLRLILTEEPSDEVRCDAPVSLWSVLEAPLDGVMSVRDRVGYPERTIRARRGALMRAEQDTGLWFGPCFTALEARANFKPNNEVRRPRLVRIQSTSAKPDRAVWLRDAALSVELWTLPEMSWLEPDGETCHVLTALTPGVLIDGRTLSRGDTVLLPAAGRRALLRGPGAQVLVAYPDVVPTQIWKPARPPATAARALDPANFTRAHTQAYGQMPLPADGAARLSNAA